MNERRGRGAIRDLPPVPFSFSLFGVREQPVQSRWQTEEPRLSRHGTT